MIDKLTKRIDKSNWNRDRLKTTSRSHTYHHSQSQPFTQKKLSHYNTLESIICVNTKTIYNLLAAGNHSPVLLLSLSHAVVLPLSQCWDIKVKFTLFNVTSCLA